jgi:RNA polymerase-binding transcription factor
MKDRTQKRASTESKAKTKSPSARQARPKEKTALKAKAPERPRAEPSKRLNEHVKTFKETLLKKKATLANYLKTELSELEAADKHHLADLEEMASDTMDTDSVCEIMALGANTIDQIDQALAKIEDGTYGVCEDCGEQIAFERLEALPFATLCVECKKRREVLRS